MLILVKLRGTKQMLYLTYREKTKCKQYVFETEQEMRKYFRKKWYTGENIMSQEYDDDGNYISTINLIGGHPCVNDSK